MSVKEIAAVGPKTGDRVQPYNSDRYYLITRIHQNKAYYRWVPGDDTPNKKWEERFCSVDLLEKIQHSGMIVWAEQPPKSSDNPDKSKTRIYKGTISYHGQPISKETVAESEGRAKSNLIAQIAQHVGVKPSLIWTYINSKPTSFEMEEVK